jgi:NAD(P)-dependent dehydrogenase (short-subunit alcohol dehydrogenase family)
MQRKVVLITGPTGGLGTFVSRAFLDAGAQVAGVSRSVTDSDYQHPAFHPFPADITQPQSSREVVAKIVNQFGRIDVLVHITGGFSFARIDDTNDETWRRMCDLNLSAGFYIAREVIPVMRKQNFGRIIAIGSLAAVGPHTGVGAYVATKSALHALYQTIALENQAAGITSNLVLPGTMNTTANRASMPEADPSHWVDPRQRPIQVTGLILKRLPMSS